jgi:GDP-L-fucose synthase
MYDLKGEDVLITGGNSMLGRAIANVLEDIYSNPICVDHNFYNLEDEDDCHRCFNYYQPDYVFHCAGYNGNIDFNRRYPANIFERTTRLALNVLKWAAYHNVSKIVSLMSSCCYPDGEEVLREENLWQGLPHPSVDAHGLSKRVINAYSRQLYKQYETISVGMICNTAYGPYDSFTVEKSKVVGGLIRRFIEAKEKEEPYITLWGSGTVRREFIYCDDVGKLAVQVMKEYNNPELPINVGSGTDITIYELAEMIASIVGFDGEIITDSSKPDGQKRKLLDNKKMEYILGEYDFLPLKEGLKRTVEWYLENRKP